MVQHGHLLAMVLLFPILLFLASLSLPDSITAEDTLTPGHPLSINQTVVSAGGIFALGFFSPVSTARSRDPRRYIGIWYNIITEKTVVWVANRENPLLDSGGVFTMAGDGNIVLLDGKGGLLWSSNVSGVPHNASAVLSDTGNLVLTRARGEDDVLWQSFDHPSDTMLPEMKLRQDVTGARTILRSWRAADDPSTGEFSMGFDPENSLQIMALLGSKTSIGFDPESILQIKMWRGSRTWARWGPGNLYKAETLDTKAKYTNASIIRMPEVGAKEVSSYFTVTEGSPPVRFFLDHVGVAKLLVWDQSAGNWSLLKSRPNNPCDFYNPCGPSGFCSSNVTSLECSCLRGFVPSDREGWNKRNFSGGCVRRVPLQQCDKKDEFFRLEMIRIPDAFVLVGNIDGERCKAECLRRCNCTAYSYNSRTSMASRTRCLLWAGELMDLRAEDTDTSAMYELNVRLAGSELGDDLETGGLLKKRKKNTIPVLRITFVTLGTVMLVGGVLGLFLKRRSTRRGKKKMKNVKMFHDVKFPSMDPNGENVAELPLLKFSTILAATENFSPANKLGEGGFGPVYKGRLPDGEAVAVKRLSRCSGQGLVEFRNEVELISRLQHKNIVQILGWCLHEEEKILIYEYLPNRSLDKFIFDSSRAMELDWEKRIHIIKGVAQGLLYLHQHSRLHVVHRDLKTSNILLDCAMNAKISDFGLAKMFRGGQEGANTDRVVGTYGYMSPEYALDGHFSEKSDVFSFGVVLLEIISGRRNTGFYHHSESLNLLGHAWKLWNEERGLELLDPSLIGSTCPGEEVSRCIHVSLLCVQETAAARPTTSEIVGMLGAETASLPIPKQPAFLMEHGSPQKLPTDGSINLMTLSSVDGR